jgi:phosphohistidine phosphatase
MARFLFRRGNTPDLIISSNAARARQTAEIFVKDLNISEKNLRLTEKLYYSSAKTILDHIYVLDDKINTVLLVGHNPGISDLVRGLSSGRESFMENTQVVIFNYEIEKWHQLDEVNLIDFHSHRVIYTPSS